MGSATRTAAFPDRSFGHVMIRVRGQAFLYDHGEPTERVCGHEAGHRAPRAHVAHDVHLEAKTPYVLDDCPTPASVGLL